MATASDEYVNIGGEKQLLVDDLLVDEIVGLRLNVHRWEKHPANPVLRADKPWEGEGRCVLTYGGAIYDQDDGIFKIWYWTANDRYEAMCYAVSEDGIEWEKPQIGLYEFNGSTANNMVMVSEGEGRNMETYGAIKCPFDPDPAGLYKACFWEGRPDGRRGVWSATSPDGIHWTKSEKPICPQGGDTVGFFYDSLAGRYVCFVKLRSDRGRARAQIESEDFVHWTQPRLIFKSDDRDDQPCDVYNNSGFVWESMRLGLLQMYYHHQHPYQSLLVLELIHSRDGRNWQRMPNRETVLDVGPDGSWDRTNQSQMNGAPIIVGDRMYTYYGGRTYYHSPYKGGISNTAIGLATMRLDGFVSRDASPLGGHLVTRPLLFEGHELHLNVKADWGVCQVELLDADGEVIPGYSKEDCRPISDDSVDAVVRWGDGTGLRQRAGRPTRLKFHLQNAQLYAFWIQ